jgi:hypothetical protein
MCIAVSYPNNDQSCITYFSDKQATLQTQSTKDHAPSYVLWGRRKNDQSLLPFGGWITLASANSEHWQKYSPTFVHLSANKFLIQDVDNNQHWFDVAEKKFIQGLLLQSNNEARCYIVTLTQHIDKTTYLLWPLIVP